MKELKNSLETRAPFTKRWVGSDGEPITADYMDLGEMSVTFELYVKEGKSGGWQRAADYFTQENLGEDAYEKLKDAGILNGFRSHWKTGISMIPGVELVRTCRV